LSFALCPFLYRTHFFAQLFHPDPNRAVRTPVVGIVCPDQTSPIQGRE
jgi:hypothetical protein